MQNEKNGIDSTDFVVYSIQRCKKPTNKTLKRCKKLLKYVAKWCKLCYNPYINSSEECVWNELHCKR